MKNETQDGAISEGLITEEGLKKLRDLEGTKLRYPGTGQYNEMASKDTIRHFADGIGDSNPLWRDEEYAQKTRWGTIMAPPSWLYSTVPTVQHGLPGVHAFHAGDDWKFYKPVLLGDRIEPEFISGRIEEVRGNFGGRSVKQYDTVNYYNKQTGEKIAEREKWTFRTERRASREKGKYAQIRLPHPWTKEELQKIDEEVLSAQPRGSKTLYWEDVVVGDKIPELVIGPIGINSEMAWCAGCRGFGGAYGIALRNYRHHPAWGYRDVETKAWEPVAAVHWNMIAAKAAGVPYPYAIGIEENSWVMRSLTDWIGDEGWLKKCYVEYRRFVYYSDVIRLGGKVTGKNVDEDGEYCVLIEIEGMNQRGENTLPGHAVVSLPSRDAGVWPVLKRLPRI